VVAEILELDPQFSVKGFLEKQYYRDKRFVEDLSANLLKAGLPD
jgi:hypothetical protein